MRTVTRRADNMVAGTLFNVNNRLAEVVELVICVELGPLGQTGPVHAPVPYYWVEIGFVWMERKIDKAKDPAEVSPISRIVVEGNHWMESREVAK